MFLGLLYPLQYILKWIFQYITNLHYHISVNISWIQDIADILDKIDTIKYLYSFLKVYKSIIYYISNPHYAEFAWALEDTLKWILSVLTNLRFDLQFRITEQQGKIEQAKSEVEQNIKWTTELNQVSELQQARLDKQIEQFKELQRVLIKA
jgi:hypothetical protein